MPEVVGDGLLGDAGESDGDCLIKGRERSGLELAQALFDDEPTSLNGVEVWGVGRQVEDAGSNPGDGLGDTCDLMGGQVVHHNDQSVAECRTEHLVELGQKDFNIRGSRYRHRGGPAFHADRSQHRYGLPAATWRALPDALSTLGATVAPCHIRSDSTLIEKNKVLGSDASNLYAPRSSFRIAFDRVLLSSVQAFFSCGSPFPRALRSIAAR